MADRQRVLARLRDPDMPTVVTNARCLTEGIDVPSLDAVVFVDPRAAPVDIVQAVGRVMRIAPGKELGNVIVPVYLTEEQLDDPEAAIESSAFEPVLAVLRALRAHDPELVTDATRIATSLGRRDAVVGGYISDHIQVLGATVDLSAFERALELRFVEVSKDRWDIGLDHLLRFVDREGTARVPRNHLEDGYPLGDWVARQRYFYHLERMHHDRIETLEALPGWTWDPFGEQWQEGYRHLRLFLAREGHTRVPPSHEEDGYPLGRWVRKRRSEHNRGGLSSARERELEALPGWTWDPREDEWQSLLDHLQRFVRREHHAQVPTSYLDPDDGFALGARVSHLRGRYPDLPAPRIEAVEALPGWTWVAFDSSWQEFLTELDRYRQAHGDATVPARHVVRREGRPDYPLGLKVTTYQSRYRRGELIERQIAELESIPGWTWSRHGQLWAQSAAGLRRYIDREGHSLVPRDRSEQGVRLGDWVSNVRAKRRIGELTPERVRELESIPGWVWEPKDQQWMSEISRLRAYAERTGTSRVPQRHVEPDGYPLGRRVMTIRRKHLRGTLSEGQVSELEALPGWTWKAR